eukprot:3941416-Rhodomonas_salina.4
MRTVPEAVTWVPWPPLFKGRLVHTCARSGTTYCSPVQHVSTARVHTAVRREGLRTARQYHKCAHCPSRDRVLSLYYRPSGPSRRLARKSHSTARPSVAA